MQTEKKHDFVTDDNRPAREMSLTIPDRAPGDTEPATAKQIAFLKRLADWKDPTVIDGLGKWQASEMIEGIISARDHLERDAEYGDFDRLQTGRGRRGADNSGGRFWTYMIGAGLVVWILVSLVRGYVAP